MITVEQIQLLESRVTKAVRKIETLQDENETLRERLTRYEKRIEELEVLINEFKDSQNDIEQGILNALSQLDELEDQVTGEADGSREANDSIAAQTAVSDNTRTAKTDEFVEAGAPDVSSGSRPTDSGEAVSADETHGDSQGDAQSHSRTETDAPEQHAAPHSQDGDDEPDAEEEQGVELDIF